MNSIIKNILAIIFGCVIGGAVNMGIIMISGSIIPPPEGADVTTMQGLQNSIHLFKPRHFLMPFLAHALGTFVGAYLAAKIAANYKIQLAFGIGFFFLLGGIANTWMIPAPTWFILLDLILAYIPMAYLAGRLGSGNNGLKTTAFS